MSADISLIIVSKDRPEQLIKCLRSLKKSSFKNFELIIVDQSKGEEQNDSFKQILKNFNHPKFIHSKQTGKSRGLNQAIDISSAPILAFTDDDCLADKKWLQTIFESFKKDKKITGLFGRTIPYQAKKHNHLICPSTFNQKELRLIDSPRKHWEEIGFGNNMAFRKNFFTKFGKFKEWLGPGSIGSNAEDAEIAQKALINKQIILFNPDAVVSHNKWLNKEQDKKQMLSYICGEMACYGYLALNGHQIGKEIISNNLKRNLLESKRIIKSILKFEFKSLEDAHQFIRSIFAQTRGLIVALINFNN